MPAILLSLSAAHLMPLLSWDWSGDGEGLLFWILATLNICSSVLLLFLPRLPLILLLTVTWLGLVGIRMPFVPNHQLLLAFFDGVLLLALLSSRGSWEERIRSALPAIGVMVVGVYFFAAFVKLNSSFLSDTNCGTEFYENIRTVYQFLPAIPGRMLAWGTVVIEFLLAILLALPRTRKIGVSAGILFHAALGLDPVKRFYNFSSVMTFGLLACFLWGSSITWKGGREERLALFALKTLLLCSLLVFVFYHLPEQIVSVSFIQMTVTHSLLWLVFSFLLVALLWKLSPESTNVKAPYHLTGISLALILLHGLSPYLGIKTGSALTMYSNLFLTASSSNHFIVPKSLDLLGVLKDEVVLFQGQPPVEGEHLPYYELYRRAGENKEAPVVFRRLSSQKLHSKRFHELQAPPFWWAHRLIRFQNLADGEKECVW